MIPLAYEQMRTKNDQACLTDIYYAIERRNDVDGPFAAHIIYCLSRQNAGLDTRKLGAYMPHENKMKPRDKYDSINIKCTGLS